MNPVVLALLALVSSLAAMPLWGKLFDHPLSRATGLPAFAALGIGAVLAIAAWRKDRRLRVRVPAGLALGIGLAFAGFFYILLKLPAPQGFTQLAVAPDFMLPDHTGKRVKLHDPDVKGPTLLVFQRGHW